jgi:hypothetical protein
MFNWIRIGGIRLALTRTQKLIAYVVVLAFVLFPIEVFLRGGSTISSLGLLLALAAYMYFVFRINLPTIRTSMVSEIGLFYAALRQLESLAYFVTIILLYAIYPFIDDLWPFLALVGLMALSLSSALRALDRINAGSFGMSPDDMRIIVNFLLRDQGKGTPGGRRRHLFGVFTVRGAAPDMGPKTEGRPT